MALNDGFQYLEQRDASDNITKEGVVGKKTSFCTSDNKGLYDTIAENFRVLYTGFTNIIGSYLKSVTGTVDTLTFTKTDDTTQDFPINNVKNTLATTTKGYLTGTTTAITNTGSLIFDSNIYLDTTAGTLTATTFNGNLTGNVTGDLTGTSSKATSDSSGNNIISTYSKKTDSIEKLSVNGITITYTKGDNTTGTITTQDTLMTQTINTSDMEYPILLSSTKTTGTRTGIFDSNITINPSTHNITTTGNITGAKVYNAVYNDYAEYFPRGEDTEPGDIIALDIYSEKEQYVKARSYNNICVGIQSNFFGHIIGGENPDNNESFEDYNIKKYIPVALCGRCNVKVVGKVKKGDLIGLSTIPGVGISHGFPRIGLALENSDDEDTKLVKVMVYKEYV